MSSRIVREVPGVQAANWNGPAQTVIAGPAAAVDQAIELAARRGIAGRLLPVSSAFHTPMVARRREPFERVAERLLGQQPDRPVYSNLDAAPHPALPAAIAARLGDHLASPVRFAEMIEAMYRDGARVFVEVGPGRRAHSAGRLGPRRPASSGRRLRSPAGPGGLAGWLDAVARLAVAGRSAPARTAHPRPRRARARPAESPLARRREPATASTWLVNGSRARPINEPEISRLGQGTIARIAGAGTSTRTRTAPLRPRVAAGSVAGREH